MSYAIDERNSERQHLLAKMLNPLTRPVLDRIPLDSVGIYQRWYRMTAEAVRPAAISKQLMTPKEFDDLLASARELEADPQAVCFKFPDVWMIANL